MSRTGRPWSAEESDALELDRTDPLRGCREWFHIPVHSGANHEQEAVYFCGNSLGLMPRGARAAVELHLSEWARLGVEGHFQAGGGAEAWYPFHEFLRGSAAKLVGALPHEVVVMNSLTVNLHLLMVSFYRPEGSRWKVLIDGPCFPSDVYAIRSQLRFHGRDPEQGIVWVRPRAGETLIRTDDVEDMLRREGETIALVLMAGVNFYSGQHFDMERITRAARAAGCIVGWDLAHAAGNVPLKLHAWGVDFAAWCSYKYLNSGPGALAGAFVHERWTRGGDAHAFASMPRFEGWWGNDPATRFKMAAEFVPVRSADAWQLSNPPILAAAPVRVSLDIFERVGMEALREKSVRLTGYLEWLIRSQADDLIEIITPAEASQRGCQLSLRARGDGRALFASLQREGVVCDFREPDVIRVAPVPLYNTFHECWRFARVLREAAAGAKR